MPGLVARTVVGRFEAERTNPKPEELDGGRPAPWRSRERRAEALLRNTRAAARTQDLADVEALERG